MKLTEYLKLFNVEKATEMMLQGKSQKEIGEEFGIPAQRISECFKYHNIKFVKRSFYVNDYYFDKIESEDKAYVLGFLVADGCVKREARKNGYSYRISFNNSIDDKEAIDLIHSKICPDAKIVISKNLHNRRKKPQYTLQWTSEYMYNILVSYGIKPRKTYDKEFKIPEGLLTQEMWRHFIRGFFDGDGHVGPETIEFVFTSEPFMYQVMSWFSNFTYRTYHIDGKTTDYWKVVINGSDSVKACIYHYLYDNAHYFLTRKKECFNTEIGYRLNNRVIEIVEHRVE